MGCTIEMSERFPFVERRILQIGRNEGSHIDHVGRWRPFATVVGAHGHDTLPGVRGVIAVFHELGGPCHAVNAGSGLCTIRILVGFSLCCCGIAVTILGGIASTEFGIAQELCDKALFLHAGHFVGHMIQYNVLVDVKKACPRAQMLVIVGKIRG